MTDMTDRIKDRSTQAPRSMVEQINAMVPQLQKALPKHLDAEKMARVALTEFRKNPALSRCSPASFFGAMLTAAQLGLEPGPLGHCYLIPYKTEVAFQMGYRGLLDLVSRSDKVEMVYAYPVYEGDKFKYSLGMDPNLQHEPCGTADPDKLSHVYAIARIRGTNIPRIEVMSREQCEAIRGRSQASASGKKTPWDTDFSEMCRKSVLKRICKTLPLSVNIQSAIAQDETVRKDVTTTPESLFQMEEVISQPVVEKPVAKKKPAAKTKPAAKKPEPEKEPEKEPGQEPGQEAQGDYDDINLFEED